MTQRMFIPKKKPSPKSEDGNFGGVLAGIKRFVDNRPLSICLDTKGKFTESPFLTGRMLTMQRVEIQALAAYLECGGLKGNNLHTLRSIDNVT